MVRKLFHIWIFNYVLKPRSTLESLILGPWRIQALAQQHSFEGIVLHAELWSRYLYLELNYMVHTEKTNGASQIIC